MFFVSNLISITEYKSFGLGTNKIKINAFCYILTTILDAILGVWKSELIYYQNSSI